MDNPIIIDKLNIRADSTSSNIDITTKSPSLRDFEENEASSNENLKNINVIEISDVTNTSSNVDNTSFVGETIIETDLDELTMDNNNVENGNNIPVNEEDELPDLPKPKVNITETTFSNDSSNTASKGNGNKNTLNVPKIPISPSSFNSDSDSNNNNTNKKLSNSRIIDLNNIDKMYHTLKNTFRGMSIDRTNIFLVITKAVEIADKMKELDGNEKYEIVSNAINIIINDLEIQELEKEFILVSIDSIIGTIIDSSKGNLFDKKKKQNKKMNDPDETQRVAIGQVIDSLLDKLITLIKKQKYTPDEIILNISVFIGMLIKTVENYSYLTTVEKKEIVIQTITIFIREKLPRIVTISDKHKQMLEYGLNMAPQTIDLLLSVRNNDFIINNIKVSKIKKFFKKVCCCC